MELDDYMRGTEDTAAYPGCGTGDNMALSYVLLALAGEAGEICNTFKKHLRGDDAAQGPGLSPARREKILGELRGTMWYLARAYRELNASMSEQAKENLDELHRRKLSGKIKGDGDKR